MLRKSMRRGFTLIELLVVLVILALLAGIVLPKFLAQGERAKVQAAKSQISTFKTAINLYAVDNGSVPTSQQGLQALVTEPTSSPRPKNWKKYLSDVSSVPKDPWQNEYVYTAPGPNGDDYFIASYGPDGKEGGGDDITSQTDQDDKK